MSNLGDKFAKKTARVASTKQVRLKLVYIDFWSVLNQTGVFDSVDTLLQDIAGAGNFDLFDFASLPQVMGFSVVVAVLNVIVITALGAIWAALYNLAVRITGGVMLGFTNK